MSKERFDVEMPYFSWRVGPRYNNGVYYADGRGKNPVKLGRHSLATKNVDQAKKNLKLLDKKLAVRHGLADPAILNDQPDHFLDLGEGAEEYLDHVKRPEVTGGATAKSAQRYQAVLNKFIPWARAQGLSAWQEVTDRTLDRYAHRLERNGYDYSTQYFELTILKQAVRTLRDTVGVGGMAQLKQKLEKPASTTTYCPTPEEVEAIIEFCYARKELKWLGEVMIALVHTGLRISELAQLRWSDVELDDGDKGYIRLPDHSRQGNQRERKKARTTKSKRSRELPIHPRLRQVFDALELRPDGRVFHGPQGGQLKPDTVLQTLKRDVIRPLSSQFSKGQSDQPDFADIKVHSFRHYFCSVCADSGVPEQMLMSWLGHTDSSMVKRYYHQQTRVAASKMEQVTFVGGTGKS